MVARHETFPGFRKYKLSERTRLNLHLINCHVLYRAGTCLFAALATNAPPFGVGVGNGDVVDLTTDSINRFQWFDKIGADGCWDNRIT